MAAPARAHEPAPDRTPDAPARTAARLDPAAAQIIALQQSAGNRAVAGLIARAPTVVDRIGMFFGKKTYLATVAGEQVHVASEDEEKDAARIIADISSRYGIDISSVKAMKALKGANKSAPKDMLAKIVKRPWLYKELQAVERALATTRRSSARCAAARRARTPTRSSSPSASWRPGRRQGRQDGRGPTVLGTYFASDKTFAMYKHGETATPDFSDIDKQIEGTVIHEIAHGVLSYAEADFVKAFDFWLDADTASGKTGAEPPPTEVREDERGRGPGGVRDAVLPRPGAAGEGLPAALRVHGRAHQGLGA